MRTSFGAVCLFVGLMVSCAPSNTKTLKFRTPEGVPFLVTNASVLMDRNTRKKIFEISIVQPAALPQSAESALSDIAFEGMAGPAAEQTGADDAIVDVFPPSSGFFSLHSGYRGHYIKEDTGSWSREDGEEPPRLRAVAHVRSPNGDSLVVTSRAIHDGELFLVFFCERCAGPDAVKLAAGTLYDIAPSEASSGVNVRRFHATVFAGVRKTAWDFPPIIFIEGQKEKSGQWRLPTRSRAQFISLIEAKLARR